MGDAFACDRCGNLRRGEADLDLIQNYNGTNNSIWDPMDSDSSSLCYECIDALQEWWENPLDDKITR